MTGERFTYTIFIRTPTEVVVAPTIEIDEKHQQDPRYVYGHASLGAYALDSDSILYIPEEIRVGLSKWVVEQKDWQKERLLSYLTVSGIAFEYILDDAFLKEELQRGAFKPI